MKVKYSFEKVNTDKPVDGYNAQAKIAAPYAILATLFNWRKEEATSWTAIIADIELVLKTPVAQNIYTAENKLHEGQYNIEQDEVSKGVRVGWGSSNAIQPVEILSTKDVTTIQDWNAKTVFHFKTSQILRLVQRWQQFLLSDEMTKKGSISFDEFTVTVEV
jgi:hypothetical protein